MYVHLEVANGPVAGKIVSLRKGDICTVGAGWKANLCLPSDPGLADLHFSVACSSDTVQIFASHPEKVLYVNGERTNSKQIAHLDWLSAGSTLFRLFDEDCPPPSVLEAPSDVLVTVLRQMRTGLYALLEDRCVRDRTLLDESAYPLFLHWTEERAAFGYVRTPHSQPWLIALTEENLSRVVRRHWSRNEAVFLYSNLAPADLRADLSRFLYASLDEQPWPVPLHLPGFIRMALMSNDEEFLSQCFRSVRRFFVEDEIPGRLIRYSFGFQKVISLQVLDDEHLLPQQESIRNALPEPVVSLAQVQQAVAALMPAGVDAGAAVTEGLLLEASRRGVREFSAQVQYSLLCHAIGRTDGRLPELVELLAHPAISAESALDLFVLAYNQARGGRPA